MNDASAKGPVTFQRDCKAVLVPDGTEATIAAGMEARVTQALGGSITVVTRYGQMFRLDAADADAIGLEPERFRAGEAPEDASLEDRIWAQLATCYDPEIPVSIVELGLVYHCKVERRGDPPQSVADVKMTLTAPGCGMGEVLVREVKQKLESLAEIDRADVELVFEPAWNPAMMSEAARLQTGMM